MEPKPEFAAELPCPHDWHHLVVWTGNAFRKVALYLKSFECGRPIAAVWPNGL